MKTMLTGNSETALTWYANNLTHTLPSVPSSYSVQPVNQLLWVANKLFSVLAQLKSTQQPISNSQLHEYVYNELSNFRQAAKASGYDDENILLACYLLSACLDVAINAHEYSSKEQKESKTSLVQRIQQKNLTEESLLNIVQKLSQAPKLFIDLIELTYVCLQLGLSEAVLERSGSKKVEREIKNSLYQIIREERGEVEKNLSRSLEFPMKVKQQIFSLNFTKITAIAVSVVALLYGSSSFLLENSVNQAMQQVNSMFKIAQT